jgi:trans-aconitate methyltransferase
VDVLCALAGVERPRLVDLGSGTGLSTRAWAKRADEVVHVEPNPAMIAGAEAATQAANVRYLRGRISRDRRAGQRRRHRDLRAIAERVLGDRCVPWWFSYRVRIGLR